MASVTVPARFNGPATSGQGGYSCAVLATLVEGPAAVSLRRHVPLDEELEVRAEDDGSVRAFAGGEVVIEAFSAPPLAPWDGPTVSLAEARAAAARFSPPAGGDFDRCFVCGEARREDGFEIFPGPTADVDVVASPWTPPTWAAGEDGVVLPELVWSALDCPGYFALHGGERLAYLARQQSELLAPIRAGETYVVVGRALERSGRKGDRRDRGHGRGRRGPRPRRDGRGRPARVLSRPTPTRDRGIRVRARAPRGSSTSR